MVHLKNKTYVHYRTCRQAIVQGDLQHFINIFSTKTPFFLSPWNLSDFRISVVHSAWCHVQTAVSILSGEGLTYFWQILWPCHASQFLTRYFESHSQTAQLENYLTSYWLRGENDLNRVGSENMFTVLNDPLHDQKHENPTMPSRY